MTCPVCQGTLAPFLATGTARCPGCGFWASTFPVRIGEGTAPVPLDEAQRRAALEDLRRRNFALVLDDLEAAGPLAGTTLCEVGCSYGWFLEMAAARGAAPLGIEPEPEVAAAAEAEGHAVRRGFFPGCLEPGEAFDAIVFHDVLEHLPDVGGALEACARHLVPGGLLAINIPSSRGVFYRLACLLVRLGVPGPFERMWQRGFPSPHLSYVDPDNLRRLVVARGFEPVSARRLETVAAAGLWSRLRMGGGNPVVAAVLYLGVLALIPLLRVLPPDIILQVYRRPR